MRTVSLNVGHNLAPQHVPCPCKPTRAVSLHPNMRHVLAHPISAYGIHFLRILITAKRIRAIFCLHPFQVTHELHLLARVP